MGKCLAAQKRFVEAAEILEDGLGHDANNVSLRYNLGWVYDELERFADANDQYTQALERDAEHHRARIARGVARARLGLTGEAEADFYAVINGLKKNDTLRQLAAYNLQHMRGPGMDFHDGLAAESFQEGVFSYTTEQYDTALLFLEEAQAFEPDVAEIPWMMMWAFLMNRDPNSGQEALVRSRELQERLIVDSNPPHAQIYVDGMDQGTAPRVVFLFASKYDVTLRSEDRDGKRQWAGPAYTDGTLGISDPSIQTRLTTVPEHSVFGPIEDADADWLADTWEESWFGHFLFTAQDDLPDSDALPNLGESLYRTNPAEVDSDHDGVTDAGEIVLYGSDPNAPNAFYYVNDADRTGDRWCTAVGSDDNDGRTPSTPKASVAALLTQYAIGPGSVICLDRGLYILQTDIEFDAATSGSREANVILQGVGPETILFRWGTVQDSVCIALDHAAHVTVRSLLLKGGCHGMRLVEPTSCLLDRCDIMDFKQTGIWSTGPTSDLEIRNTLVAGGTYGLLFVDGHYLGDVWREAVRVRNCTVADNSVCAIHCANSKGVSVQNSIVSASGLGAFCFETDRLPLRGSFDNNCYHVSSGALFANVKRQIHAELGTWQTEAAEQDNEVHSISADPRFAGPVDYHVRSTAGRLHQGSWVADELTSPCVDKGGIFVPYDKEPGPHGRRVNLGRYGGTAEASKSETGLAGGLPPQ
jgi:tetratricopeptide (TPR) repeat protein